MSPDTTLRWPQHAEERMTGEPRDHVRHWNHVYLLELRRTLNVDRAPQVQADFQQRVGCWHASRVSSSTCLCGWLHRCCQWPGAKRPHRPFQTRDVWLPLQCRWRCRRGVMLASAWGKHRQDFGTLLSILNAANSLNAANQERGHEERCDCEYIATVAPPGSPKPFCASAVAVAIVAVNTAVTARPPGHRPNTGRASQQLHPLQPTDEGSEHCWVSPLVAIVRSTARKITGRMFDEGGAHRSSLTADRQVKSFHAFQDPAE